MYRVDNATSANVIPTPAAVGPHPNSFFTNGDPQSGIPGTILPADWCNAVQEEICKVITDAGLTLSKTDRGQLSQAISSGIASNKPPYGTSASSPNAYTVSVTPVPPAYAAGLLVFVKFTNANTGAVTINVNSLGVKSVVKPDNSALISGDISAGQVGALIYDGTNFVLIDVSATNYATKAGIQTSSYSNATDTGAANAYVITLTPAITAYTAGVVVRMKSANTNTGASTVNVNSVGVQNIKLTDGSDPYAGAILSGGEYILYYDGTNFQLLNPTASRAAQNNKYNYSADGGSANTYTATLIPALTAYVTGTLVQVKITNANTGASTLNVNGLGAQSIKHLNGGALVAGELVAGMIAFFYYDGTNFQLLNPNYDGAWLTATPTTVGFSSLSVAIFRYKIIGKTCFVFLKIAGTSNATTFSITNLPAVSASIGSGNTPIFTGGQLTNNGAIVASPVYGLVNDASTQLDLFTTPGGAGWTAANAKGCFISFFYEIG